MVDQDLEHLRLLSIFHYVVGGVLAFFSCFFLVHVTVGLMMIMSPQTMTGPGGPPPAPFFGWLFLILGGSLIVFGWSLATCFLIAGRCLARRRHYLFCMITAGLGCLWIPFGTVLGVFTFIVLLRPGVKELFSHARPSPSKDLTSFQEKWG